MTITTKYSVGDKVAWWDDDLGKVVKSTIVKVEASVDRNGAVDTTYWTMVRTWGRRIPAYFTDKEVRMLVAVKDKATKAKRSE